MIIGDENDNYEDDVHAKMMMIMIMSMLMMKMKMKRT